MISCRPRLRFILPALLWAGAMGAQAGDEQPPMAPHWSASDLRAMETSAPVATLQQDFSALLGPESRRWGSSHFSIPFSAEERRLDASRSIYSRALSIQWQHQADADNRYTVTARRNNARTSDVDPATASGLAASVAWRRMLNEDAQIISRLHLGDEESRALQTGLWGRRYYGLEFEGRYQLWARHAPFASLNWRRSDYEITDSLSLLGNAPRRENRSRVAAGWEYQPLPNWGVRAEASLRLNEDALDPADNDRSRLYFSTRYGFR